MINKLQEIANGWKNYMFQDPIVEKVAISRAEICSQCPRSEYSKIIQFLLKEKRIREIEGMICNACGCPLSAKCRSLKSPCPESKWPEVETFITNKNMKTQVLKVKVEEAKRTLCKTLQELKYVNKPGYDFMFQKFAETINLISELEAYLYSINGTERPWEKYSEKAKIHNRGLTSYRTESAFLSVKTQELISMQSLFLDISIIRNFILDNMEFHPNGVKTSAVDIAASIGQLITALSTPVTEVANKYNS